MANQSIKVRRILFSRKYLQYHRIQDQMCYQNYHATHANSFKNEFFNSCFFVCFLANFSNYEEHIFSVRININCLSA